MWNNISYLNIGYPQQFFIYCDIVQHQMIGDTKAPLLRIATISDPVYGRSQSILFNPIHYLSLAKYHFNTIEIVLRDHAGRKVPFQFGTVTVKLHFYRSSSS